MNLVAQIKTNSVSDKQYNGNISPNNNKLKNNVNMKNQLFDQQNENKFHIKSLLYI